MGEQSYNDDQLCLLCLACVDELGPVGIRRLVEGARAAGLPLAKAIGLPSGRLEKRFGLAPKAAANLSRLKAPLLTGEAVVDALSRLGARAVFEGSAQYPARLAGALGASAPPVLFMIGDPAVLGAGCVAVVGSRTPSREAARAAQAFAQSQAAAGMTVVSGGAHGIDTLAHAGALAAGATAVIPASGIARFTWQGAMPQAVAGGRWCVLGQFPPEDRWRKRSALIRNRTIVAASDAVVGFEPREVGGTRHSCRIALQMGKPLFVVSGRADPSHRRGMERLVRLGAEALDLGNMPGAADFQQLTREYRPPPESAQLRLFQRKET